MIIKLLNKCFQSNPLTASRDIINFSKTGFGGYEVINFDFYHYIIKQYVTCLDQLLFGCKKNMLKKSYFEKCLEKIFLYEKRKVRFFY